MKPILLLAIFFTPLFLPAQNWQNICSPGVTFYQKNGSLIEAFRVDSTDLSLFPDTIFLSYHSIRDTAGAGECNDTTGGSFFGLQVRKTTGGIFWFYNRHGDSLMLHTMEGTGFSWKFISDPAGNYIEATMNGKILDTVCGIADSAKIISFQGKDKNGNNIPHILNGNYIKLSKHYGLTRMMEIYSAPYSPDMYLIIGKSSPLLGIQNLTWNEIYDYSIGDEFHYIEHESSYLADIYYYTINNILDRQDFPELHKVVYTIEECKRKDLPGPPFHVYFHDTVTKTYSFVSDSAWVEQMPREFIRNGDEAAKYSRTYPSVNGRQSHTISGGTEYNGNCWIHGVSYYPVSTLTTGLGRTGYLTWNIYNNTGYTYSLSYYKKGTETWGTPVASGCNTLLGLPVSQHDNPQRTVSLFPNPVSDMVTIQIDEFQPGNTMEFTLLDFLGREIFQSSITVTPCQINLSNLPRGLYVWQITGVTGTTTGKLVLE